MEAEASFMYKNLSGFDTNVELAPLFHIWWGEAGNKTTVDSHHLKVSWLEGN